MKMLCILVVLGIFCIGYVRSMDTIFANNELGYLYSEGKEGYVYNTPVTGEGNIKSVLAISERVDEVTPLKVIRREFKDITYHIIAAPEELCNSAGDSPQNTAACVFSYNKNLGNRTGLVLAYEKPSFNNYFMFSLPLTNDTNGFQIYNQGQCVTIDSMGALDLAECIDADSLSRQMQIFRWVDKKWYDHGMARRNSPNPK
ncbi:hypothetical protein NERG_01038 [Nematocida ausubeli]|uniref:Uncharacterized protein n=1 Tax=Nematocida ausubeli (strain ATCC PRA-371 / ERTm2) TaxID=1913371 RepID=H8ZAH4_NEMA1|nr:hypothetical protein NERG_01038 [Nematocida ausubeli]